MRKVLKIVLATYIASYLLINWNDISWIFNYRAVNGMISSFFNPYPSINASDINAYFYPNVPIDKTSVPRVATPRTIYTEKQNILEIPKLSLELPIIFATSTDVNVLHAQLDLGVVYYPGSVYPGQLGQIVILGHSAPPGWPKIKHDWAFSDINELAEGDSILIDFDNKQYTYIVKKKIIIKKGADIPQDSLDSNAGVLNLISCWPPGKNYQRIVVQAKLLDD